MTAPILELKTNNGTNVNTASPWRTSVALIAAALIVAGCGKTDPKTPDKDAGAPRQGAAAATSASAAQAAEAGEDKLVLSAEEIKVAGVAVATLQEQAISEQVTGTASIEANQDRRASVAPRAPGRITRVVVNLGEHVRAGQALAFIDSVEVGEAQSAYAQAHSDYALAQSAMERADKLFADQIIPQKDHLRARADLEKARAVLRAASERLGAYGVRAHGGASSSATATFAVTAPFAGTVIDKKAVLGELAQPDKPLFEVADLSTVWIETHLYEKDLARVRVGSAAEVTVAAYPDERFKGTVAYVGSVMDGATRTVPARVVLANPDGRLKLGMFATAAIATAGTGKALTLPADAVVLIAGQPTIFVQVQGGFEARPVQLGDKRGAAVVLASGIAPGSAVVTRGAYALKAKMLKSQISAE